MKTTIKYFPIPFICIFLFQVSGCIDETNYKEPQISGLVYDINGFPVPECTLSVINYPVAVTNDYGMFQLENVLNPYDLTVNLNAYHYIKYLGIKNFETKIYNPFNYAHGNKFRLQASFPQFSPNQILLLKFIGDEDPVSETVRCIPGDTAKVIEIYFKIGTGSTHGKLIYLLVTFDETGFFIQSYDAYAVKEITLNNNTNLISFIKDDLIYNVPYKTMNFSIRLPGTYFDFTNVLIHFSGKDKNSDMELMTFWEIYDGQFRVPMIPGLNYKIKTENEYYVHSEWSYDGSRFSITEPGGYVSIMHKPLINLSISGLYQYRVWDTTDFIADDEESEGIYFFTLGKRGYEYDNDIMTIITDKNRIKFRDFYSRGFVPEYYAYYKCHVHKITGCRTIDEFTSLIYPLNDNFSFKIASEKYTFRAGP